MENEMRKLPTRQNLSVLCADDIVRDPKTGRLVRLVTSGGEAGNAYTGFQAADLETGAETIVLFRNSSTVNVWIG
jgi:hypothetical protein